MLIAGTQSGCGKTTITLALMQYFRERGQSIAPFKAGPDFLDPMWHGIACGTVSWNLDTRMMGVQTCQRRFFAASKHANISMIEGVMGLFDGAKGVGGEGSAAHLAKVLGEPVILVVSAKGMSGSIVALVEGFVARARHMGVQIAGIIANHVGSENHARILRELLCEYALPPLMAWMQKQAPVLPQIHLGVMMPVESSLPDFSAHFHVENMMGLCVEKQVPSLVIPPSADMKLDGKRIAIAKDEAFCFMYPANVEWLEAQGLRVQFFSPLAGEPVPERTDALWLPGGYPELHAERLSGSASWASVLDFIEADKPVLAECGGMMVLGKTLYDTSGHAWPMAGVLPCDFRMQDKLVSLGYREEEGGVRGHEFHYSSREEVEGMELCKAFDVSHGDQGLRYKNLRASYVHWYFAGQPAVVASWFGFARSSL